MGDNRLKPQNSTIPWVVSFEFPCYADAKAFALLAEEQFGDKALLRKKNVVFQQGAFANWRTTTAIRAALSGRSFTHEMIGEALANHGYAGTRSAAATWVARAHAEGVVVRVERGVYEFCPLSTGAVATSSETLPCDSLCLSCQPEALQCQPA